MAEQDLNNRQNIDLGKRGTDDPEIPEHKKKYSDEAGGIAEVNVKNAHATGDGSMGSTDKRLDDDGDAGDPEID